MFHFSVYHFLFTFKRKFLEKRKKKLIFFSFHYQSIKKYKDLVRDKNCGAVHIKKKKQKIIQNPRHQCQKIFYSFSVINFTICICTVKCDTLWLYVIEYMYSILRWNPFTFFFFVMQSFSIQHPNNSREYIRGHVLNTEKNIMIFDFGLLTQSSFYFISESFSKISVFFFFLFIIY